MTLNCKKINLKRGSRGKQVQELQQILQEKKLYTGKIDSKYGELTEEAVKKLQKQLGGLKQDGVFGSATCTKLQGSNNASTTTTKKSSTTTSNTGKKTTTTKTQSYEKNGVYYSSPHWTSTGCNKLGQCTPYYCGVHSIRQCNAKQDIDKYKEQQLASWAGTTTAGTSHQGLETALAIVAQKENRKIKVEWKNFSDLGNTIHERFKKIGEIIAQQNKDIIIHNKYRNKYGHYEVLKEVNTNNNTCKVLNSLGNRCNKPAYYGYIETRSFSTFASYIAGISQKSIMIITYT